MPYEPSIDLTGTRTVCINEAYLGICDEAPSAYCAAMLLRDFQHLHDCRVELAEIARSRAAVARAMRVQLTDTSSDWMPATANTMVSRLLGTYRRRTVQLCLAWLSSPGSAPDGSALLDMREDPDLPGYQARQYRFNVASVQLAITRWRSQQGERPSEPDLLIDDIVHDVHDDAPAPWEEAGSKMSRPTPASTSNPGSKMTRGAGNNEPGPGRTRFENEPHSRELDLARESRASSPPSGVTTITTPAGCQALGNTVAAPSPSPEPHITAEAGMDSARNSSPDAAEALPVDIEMRAILTCHGLDARAVARCSPFINDPARVRRNVALYDTLLHDPERRKRPRSPMWLVTAIERDIAGDRAAVSGPSEREDERSRARSARTVGEGIPRGERPPPVSAGPSRILDYPTRDPDGPSSLGCPPEIRARLTRFGLSADRPAPPAPFSRPPRKPLSREEQLAIAEQILAQAQAATTGGDQP